ncbi:MAG: hypothetical protein LBI33_07690 [Propionibacteriaceae bacterium]|jgi:hypothetical protein|nr:hypothetical protein [Propionibacteriaceae bacterium]
MATRTAVLPRAIRPSAGAPDWVLAAPFRAHVTYLMSNAHVPWPVIAHQASIPLATLRTLLFGRGGRSRAKITRDAATRLIGVGLDDLRWMLGAQVSAGPAGARIRLLRGHHAPWANLARYLGISVATCQGYARGEYTSCSVMFDILTQTACEAMDIIPWDEWGLEPPL